MLCEESYDKLSYFWDMVDLNGVMEFCFLKLEEGCILFLDDFYVVMSVNLDVCIFCGFCVWVCCEV